jgi:hypothetical protein
METQVSDSCYPSISIFHKQNPFIELPTVSTSFSDEISSLNNPVFNAQYVAKEKEFYIVTIGRIVGETRHKSILKSWFLYLDFYAMFRPMIRLCDVLTRSYRRPYLSGRVRGTKKLSYRSQGSLFAWHVLGILYWL